MDLKTKHELMNAVSARLGIPVERLEEWRMLKKISVQPIEAGWKLTICGEPARTEITNAHMAQRLRLIATADTGAV